MSFQGYPGGIQVERTRSGGGEKSIGGRSILQTGSPIEDTGYSIQDTGIEGCKCKDAGIRIRRM